MLGIQKTLNKIEKARHDAYMAGLTDILGIRFKRVGESDTENAKIEDGVVYLSLNPDTYEIDTIYHEVAHTLDENPKTRDSFAKYKETLRKAPAFEKAVTETIQRYKDAGKKYNRALIESEVSAEFAINIIREVANGRSKTESVRALKRVVNGNPSLADRIYQGVRKLRLTMKDANARVYTDDITGISLSYKDLLMTESLFEGMLKDVAPEYYSEMSTMYSLKTDNKGKKYWEIDTDKDIFKGLKTKKEYREAAFDFLLSQRDNEVVVNDSDGKEIVFRRVSAEEFTRSEESNNLYKTNPEMFGKKMRLVPSLQDILLSADVNWHSPDHKNHKLFKNGFENYRGRVRIDDVIFSTIVRVGKADLGNVFYDINLEVDSYLPHTKTRASDIKNESTSIDIISQSNKNVNTNERFRLKKNNDLGNFGVKIDSELTGFSHGKMSKVWNDFQKRSVEEEIRNAYRSYKDGDTKEGNRALNEAGRLWSSALKKGGNGDDVKEFVKHFKSAFQNQEAKKEAMARRQVSNPESTVIYRNPKTKQNPVTMPFSA